MSHGRDPNGPRVLVQAGATYIASNVVDNRITIQAGGLYRVEHHYHAGYRGPTAHHTEESEQRKDPGISNDKATSDVAPHAKTPHCALSQEGQDDTVPGLVKDHAFDPLHFIPPLDDDERRATGYSPDPPFNDVLNPQINVEARRKPSRVRLSLPAVERYQGGNSLPLTVSTLEEPKKVGPKPIAARAKRVSKCGRKAGALAPSLLLQPNAAQVEQLTPSPDAPMGTAACGSSTGMPGEKAAPGGILTDSTNTVQDKSVQIVRKATKASVRMRSQRTKVKQETCE